MSSSLAALCGRAARTAEVRSEEPLPVADGDKGVAEEPGVEISVPTPVTDVEDVLGSARKGHFLCLHLLFDLGFVQLEHSLQGGEMQAVQLLHAFRGGFLFCFPPVWRGFITTT